jgi:hypothetical protein
MLNVVMLFVIVQLVVVLIVVMLLVVMLLVIMLLVVMLFVVMLNVVAPKLLLKRGIGSYSNIQGLRTCSIKLQPRNPYCRRRISTIDLLVLTSLD